MTFYCGIDVAKHKHAVVVLNDRGQIARPVFETENTHAGLEALLELLQQIGNSVSIGLEATGHYWLSLYDILTQHGHPVAVINPLQIAASPILYPSACSTPRRISFSPGIVSISSARLYGMGTSSAATRITGPSRS